MTQIKEVKYTLELSWLKGEPFTDDQIRHQLDSAFDSLKTKVKEQEDSE